MLFRSPAEHHGRVARDLRAENGPAAVAEASLPHIEAALEDDDAVLVDGIRSDDEVDAFEERFGEAFVLVSIEAPFEVRQRRLGDRGRDEVDGDAERLAARDERERGFGLGDAMERADVTIDNTDSLDAYRERVREVLR